VALTAYATAADRDRALREGFQLHVPKPVDPPQLVSRIAEALRYAPVPRSA